MDTDAASVDASLRALEAWLSRRAPALVASLGPAVEPDALAEVEARLGCALPADYRAFLARHDGQRFVPTDEASGTLAPLLHGLDLLPAAFALSEYDAIDEDWGDAGPGPIVAVGPVRPLYKHARWWPITCVFGASQYHCLDMDPAPGGAVGQVIFVADDDEHRRVVAPSFAAFLARLVATLDARDVVATDDGVDLPDEVFDSLLDDGA